MLLEARYFCNCMVSVLNINETIKQTKKVQLSLVVKDWLHYYWQIKALGEKVKQFHKVLKRDRLTL